MKNFGSTSGLTILAEDQATPANGMVNYITSSYQSGWQNGDIKGAFLSDTDDTDLVGSGNLWSGTPAQIDAGWTDNGDGSFTSSGGDLIGWASGKLVIGKTYVVKITVDSRTSGGVYGPYDGSGANQNQKYTTGDFCHTFIAMSTGLYVYSSGAATVSGIEVYEADADRSVNG